MNAEALIGKVVGTCTLQKLIGQGGMGAVFLAQQSRPRRQVAVKVLLPIVRLNPNQQAAFLERFRRETDAAASLDHPNILPVHEYGERDGLAYLVMPYVSGGTLRDELEREGPLPLAKVVNYLDQLAAALEVAHGRGVVHRDIKPANILKTAEGRLLLTDFGLVKVIAEGQAAQVSLTGAGVPLGTPDYMAPEQVMGGEIDARADLYALGIVLYQMVTGKTPFKGEMPMQVAMQHVNATPPSPRALRPDLPLTAEQVMFRAIAKKPVDRYANAQDLASAFRLALAVSGVQLATQKVGGGGPMAPGAESRLFTPRGLFDPSWQTGMVPTVQHKPKFGGMSRVNSHSLVPLTPRPSADASATQTAAQNDIVAKTSMTLASLTDLMPPANPASNANMNTPYTAHNPYTPVSFSPEMTQGQGSTNTTNMGMARQSTTGQTPVKPRFVHKTGLLRSASNSGIAGAQVPQTSMPPSSPYPNVPSTPARSLSNGNGNFNPPSPFPTNRANGTSGTSTFFSGSQSNAGILPSDMSYAGQGPATTVKLTQSFKVIQVPVAGQPGQYVTGLLPVQPQDQEGAVAGSSTSNLEPLLSGTPLRAFNKAKKNVKVLVLAAAVFLVLFSSSVFWFVSTHSQTKTAQQRLLVVTPNATATAGIRATATMQANTILSDPLRENSHNWHVSTGGPQQYIFKDNAYHITNNDTKSLAIALLPDETVNSPYAYSLTMQALSGDETTITNQFGLVFDFNVRQKDGKTYKSFYIFEVANTKGGHYQLLKYDDSGDQANGPWTTIWSNAYGDEFHAGHGQNSTNTFKIAVNGDTFTMTVNNKKVGDARDGSLKSGLVGMLVNLNKTEVAFSNLLLTYK